MNKIFRYMLLLMMAMCIGCKVGPEYERPEIDLPDAWQIGIEDANSIADINWWSFFEDQTLPSLIQTALEENKDLKIAIARINEARGVYRATYGEQWPQLDAGSEIERSQESREDSPGAKAVDNYIVGAVVSWELDFWGKLARSTEAARAELLAADDARQAVILSLVNDVAQTYFELQNLDRQIDITEDTIVSRQKSLEIAKKRFKGGVTSRLEVVQSESELASAMAALPELRFDLRRQEYALSILLGRNPEAISRGLNLESQSLPEQLPSGLPIDLLRRRPDIRAAEHQLMAATARIGVAEAQFYPNISFSTALFQESPHASSLFNSSATAWEILADATMPIFSAGRLEGNLQAAEARYEQEKLVYEQTILEALREVNSILAGYYEAIEVRKAQEQLVKSNREYTNLAWLMYNNGEVAYIDYLDAERKLFDAELKVSQIIRDQLNALVRLYTALGGGWKTDQNEDN